MDTKWWQFLLTALALCPASAHEEEYFPWCGGKLNPREQATAMRLATDIMHACKDDIIKLNVSPLVLREAERLCIMFKICFAYGGHKNDTLDTFRRTYNHCIGRILHMTQVLDPAMFIKYRANATTVMEAATRCSYQMIPREDKYTLAALGYFRNFISG
ncbi:uncharacterized protein LOC144144897 [Haemaphysalis longicornis]